VSLPGLHGGCFLLSAYSLLLLIIRLVWQQVFAELIEVGAFRFNTVVVYSFVVLSNIYALQWEQLLRCNFFLKLAY